MKQGRIAIRPYLSFDIRYSVPMELVWFRFSFYQYFVPNGTMPFSSFFASLRLCVKPNARQLCLVAERR